MAWAVWCPPTDERDYRVYFTQVDAEVADDGFRDDAMTDEDDADRRTQGAIPLYPAPPAGHIMESDGTVRPRPLGQLPTTGDGVAFGMGANLFRSTYDGIRAMGVVEMEDPNDRHWEDYPDGARWTIRLIDENGDFWESAEGELYSTREAAEAAQRAAGGGV
jgi:hypothetical protein